MDKKLIVLAAAVCLACPAFAQQAAEKKAPPKTPPAKKAQLPPPGPSFSMSGATVALADMDLDPAAPRPVTLLKKEGKTDGTATYKVSVPKNKRFRLLWKTAPVSKTEKMLFKAEMTSPADKTYKQGVIKELKYEDEESSGVIFDCLATGGEINVEVESSHAKWQFEVQLLK